MILKRCAAGKPSLNSQLWFPLVIFMRAFPPEPDLCNVQKQV